MWKKGTESTKKINSTITAVKRKKKEKKETQAKIKNKINNCNYN